MNLELPSLNPSHNNFCFHFQDSDLNQILFSRANEKSDLERRIGLQRIAWALEHGNREEPNREGFKNHMVELGPRASAGGTKNWNGKR